MDVNLLGQMAAKAAGDPAFLACALARCRRRHNLSLTEQASRLGIDPELMPRLALCRAPLLLTWDWDLRAICGRFGIDRDVLEAMISE